MFNVENLAGKLSDCSFINYVSSFDLVCLTETFADATFDFNGLFTEHVKFVAPAKRQGINSGGVLLLIKRAVCKFVKQIQINCANTVAVRIVQYSMQTKTLQCLSVVLFMTLWI